MTQSSSGNIVNYAGRMEKPFYTLNIEGEKYQFSVKHGYSKAVKHLNEDFMIPIDGKTKMQTLFAYMSEIKKLIIDRDAIVQKNSTFQYHEFTLNFVNPKTLRVAIFAKNNTDEKTFTFISSYVVSEQKFKEFVKTCNLGISLEQHAQLLIKRANQKSKKQQTTLEYNEFQKSLPKEAKISAKQVEECEKLLENSKGNYSNFTIKQNQTLARLERYKTLEEAFLKDKTNNN